jgi:hypothetical protein
MENLGFKLTLIAWSLWLLGAISIKAIGLAVSTKRLVGAGTFHPR